MKKSKMIELLEGKIISLSPSVKSRITIQKDNNQQMVFEKNHIYFDQEIIDDKFIKWMISTKTGLNGRLKVTNAVGVINANVITKWINSIPWYNRKKFLSLFMPQFLRSIENTYDAVTNNDTIGDTPYSLIDYLTAYCLSDKRNLSVYKSHGGVSLYEVPGDMPVHISKLATNILSSDGLMDKEIDDTVDRIMCNKSFDHNSMTDCELYIHDLVEWSVYSSLSIISPDAYIGSKKYNPFIQ